MIYNEELKIAFMLPERTGSRSIYHLLISQFDFRMFANKDSRSSLNVCHLPKQMADFKVYATVRHEMIRIPSLWYMKWKPRHIPWNFYFDNYLFDNAQDMLHEQLPLSNKYIPPKGFVQYEITGFIRLESLVADLEKIPFIADIGKIEIPHIRDIRSEYPPIPTPEQQERIWAATKGPMKEIGYRPKQAREYFSKLQGNKGRKVSSGKSASKAKVKSGGKRKRCCG